MSNNTPEGTPEDTNHWPGLATKRCDCGYPAEVDSTRNARQWDASKTVLLQMLSLGTQRSISIQ